jgi:co-chaperonin GroES (HSP10)
MYGSIYIPEGSREKRTYEGVVIAAGSDCTWVKPGDTVVYGMYDGQWLVRGREKFRIINEEDTLGKATRRPEGVVEENDAEA